MSEEIKNASTTTTGETPALDDAAENIQNKGKGKAVEAPVDDEDEDDDDDDEEEDMDDEDEDEDEEDFSEIDPSAIITSSRRSTRSTVDYSSAEAAKKAGLADGIEEEEEADADQTFDEDSMKD